MTAHTTSPTAATTEESVLSDPESATTAEASARIAVIGGSGLYDLLPADGRTEIDVATPYGPPSGTITLGRLGARTIAFLSRHGAGHALAPHEIDYRANMWALASLGVRTVVSSCAVGSLDPELPVGGFVVPDQLLDRTHRRASSFSGDGLVIHLPFADPFTPELVELARTALRGVGEDVPERGTVAVIEGPRFSTRIESRLLRSAGADLVNMTQYPESALAQELGMGVVSLAHITDSDAGTTAAEAVDPTTVIRRLADARPRIIAALTSIVDVIDEDLTPPRLVDAAVVRRILERPVVESATASMRAVDPTTHRSER